MDNKSYYTVTIHTVKTKIDSNIKDIIKLKSENRNLANKLKGMVESIKHWQNRKHESYDDTRLRNCLDARLRDLDWMVILCRLQINSNGKLIRKHRAKIKELRTELSVLEFILFGISIWHHKKN